jgi:hypothetical protein
MRQIGLEVVVVGVQINQEAIRQDGHGGDDVENYLADSLVNQEAVGNIGCISEVELQMRWVDEGYLRSANLCRNVSIYWWLPEYVRMQDGLIPEG